MVTENNTLLLTPDTKPQDLSIPLQPLSPHWQTWGKDSLVSYGFKHHIQSHVVKPDNIQFSADIIIGTHKKQQQGTIIQESDKPWQHLYNFIKWSLGKQQTLLICPWGKGSTVSPMIICFPRWIMAYSSYELFSTFFFFFNFYGLLLMFAELHLKIGRQLTKNVVVFIPSIFSQAVKHIVLSVNSIT